MLQRLHKSMEKRERGLHPHRAPRRHDHHRHPGRDRYPDLPQPAEQRLRRRREERPAEPGPQQELYFDDHAGVYVVTGAVVTGADGAITTAMPGWHKSSGVTSVTLAKGIKNNAADGWCATAVSKSGDPFFFDSANGAVQSGSCTNL